MVKLAVVSLGLVSLVALADTGSPPVAKVVPHPTEHFGHELEDNYFWMRSQPADGVSFSPDVVSYVADENVYTTAFAQNWGELRARLGTEIENNNSAQADLSVPTLIGGYQYLMVNVKPTDLYPSYVKQLPDGSDQTVLLDGPALAGNSTYFGLQVGPLSPDGRYLPYGIDRLGNRNMHLYIKDLQAPPTASPIDVQADKVNFQMPYAPALWSSDSRYLFYGIFNDLLSESGVNKYEIATAQVSTVYTLDDLSLLPEISPTSSSKYILINLNYSIRTSTIKIIPSASPETPPVLFTPVDRKLMYAVDHMGDRFYVIGNKDGDNRDLYWTPETATSIENWKKVTPKPLMKDIIQLQAMNDGIVVLGINDDARQAMKIVHPQDGSVIDVPGEGPDTVYYFTNNPDPTSKTFIYSTRTHTHFPTQKQIDLTTGEVTVLKTSTDPASANYVTERKWVWAPKSTENPWEGFVHVPFDIVYKKGALKQDGNRPVWLYAYGNYGENLFDGGEIDFLDSDYRTLLEQNVIVVFAYVRGGADRGRDWYLNAMQHTKRNSFSDFASVAEYLIKHKVTNPSKIVAEGISAAGLLMGNMANFYGQLFKAVVLDDPFVDEINTLSDTTIHLTSQEWGEWGDPVHSEDDYDYIRTYAPYDNVAARAYPDLLFFSSMDDSQVPYWEPMKMLARIRANKTDKNIQLLHMDLNGSHDGGSGQAGVDDDTYRYAFILNELGIATAPAVAPLLASGAPSVGANGSVPHASTAANRAARHQPKRRHGRSH